MDPSPHPLPPGRRLREAWDARAAFEAGGREFTMWDVFAAAAARGDLAAVWAEVADAGRAEAAAGLRGEELDLAVVEKLIEEFRYARGLESAEDAEAWLERRGLGADDLTAFALRRYWSGLARGARSDPSTGPGAETTETGDPGGEDQEGGEAAGGDSAVEDAEPEPGADEGDEAGEGGQEEEEEGEDWLADLVFSGEYDRLARLLARQAALALDGAAPPASAGGGEGDGDGPVEDKVPEAPDEWAGFARAWRLEVAQVREWREWAARYASISARIQDPAERARVLAEQGWNLLWVVLDILEFDSEAGAREALLCVTDDHLSLAEVAATSGFVVRRWAGWVRDVPESWRTPVVCSAPGRVLGPLVVRGLYCVVQIVSETDPVADDPAVAREIDRMLEERVVADVERRTVRWHLAPEGPA